jgi:RND superfamily putative drug exporter
MTRRSGDRTVADMSDRTAAAPSTLGRLGAWAARRRRLVVVAWAAAVLVLGALAPFADRALSGAGWEAQGSESAHARRAIDSRFPGQGTYALSVVVAGGSHRSATRRCARRSRACAPFSGATRP